MQFDPILAVLAYVVFVYSTVCHEAAHAWAALKLGDDTAYRGGQVSLDPVPHIRREPFGMVVLPLIGLFTTGMLLGWASAPYDPHWARQYPRRSAWMALAGPAANFILCLGVTLLMIVGAKMGVFGPSMVYARDQVVVGVGGRGWEVAAQILSMVFSMNLLLGIFNLMPCPPLDGSAVPLLWLKGRAADAYQNFIAQPGMQIIAFVVAWQGFGLIFGPTFRWAHDTLERLAF